MLGLAVPSVGTRTMEEGLGWLKLGGAIAYIAIVFFVVRYGVGRWLPPSFRKPLAYGLWLGVPLLMVSSEHLVGTDWTNVVVLTILPAGLAALTAK